MINYVHTYSMRLFIGLLVIVVGLNCQQHQAFILLKSEIQEDGMRKVMQQLSKNYFSVISPDVLQSALQRNKAYIFQLEQIDEARLNEDLIAQKKLLLQELQKEQLEWSTWKKDPSRYNAAAEIKRILAHSQMSSEEKLLAVQQTFRQSAAYYQAAKKNLVQPLPERIQLASQKQILGLQFLAEEFPKAIRKEGNDQVRTQSLIEDAQMMQVQLKDYIAFCESMWFEHLDTLYKKESSR